MIHLLFLLFSPAGNQFWSPEPGALALQSEPLLVVEFTVSTAISFAEFNPPTRDQVDPFGGLSLSAFLGREEMHPSGSRSSTFFLELGMSLAFRDSRARTLFSISAVLGSTARRGSGLFSLSAFRRATTIFGPSLLPHGYWAHVGQGLTFLIFDERAPY